MQSDVFYFAPDNEQPTRAELKRIDASGRLYWDLIGGLLGTNPKPEPDSIEQPRPEPPPILVPLKGAVETAMDFLTATLARGEMAERDVQRLAFAARIKGRTLRRARERLGVKSMRHGARWWWSLPGGGAEA
jgi:hypothetical protein